jgi:methyl-accepting chemotaxis protein
MPGLSGAAVVVLQESEFTKHDIHLAMIFLAIIAIALVAQAVGVIISGLFAAKLSKKVEGLADTIEMKTMPILDKANQVLHDLSPKVLSITQNAEQISYTVRTKVDELSVTVSELNETVRGINQRTRGQVVRVDGIVTDALVATEEISQTVQNGIKVPLRQIAGVIAGLRAGMETLIERSPFRGRG